MSAPMAHVKISYRIELSVIGWNGDLRSSSLRSPAATTVIGWSLSVAALSDSAEQSAELTG